jgi:hypothetical protein
MPIDLILPVSDVDSFIGTASNQYDSMRLYSASSRGGSYSLVTTITLVAGDTSYSYTHASGTISTWYKIALYNSVTANEQSLDAVEPFPASRNTTTRKELRQRIIQNFGGKILTPSSITATTVVDATTLKDGDEDDESYEGWQIYRPDAADTADRNRRVSAYDKSTGTVTHAGSDYTDTTETDEQIELMPLDIDLTFLNEKIGDALEETRWLYRYEFGANSGVKQYSLPHFVESDQYVKEIWRRTGSTGAYIWRTFDYGAGFAKVRGSNFQCVLDISPSIGESEVIALEVFRQGERLDSETDFTLVTFKWAEAAAMVEVLQHIVTIEMAREQKTEWSKLLPIWKEKLRQQARKKGVTPGLKVTVPHPFSSSFPDV